MSCLFNQLNGPCLSATLNLEKAIPYSTSRIASPISNTATWQSQMPTQLIAANQQVVPISPTGQIQANYKVGELIPLANSY